MSWPVRSLCRGALIAGATLFATSAFAQMELKIIAPAAPGGGWDQTARSIQQALIAEKLVKSAQVINIAGAGGTVGLAQFVNGAKGDGNQLMVNGFVMVGSLIMNKSPVSPSCGFCPRDFLALPNGEWLVQGSDATSTSWRGSSRG